MPSRSRRLAACLALVVGAGALSSIAPVAAAPDDQAFAPLRGFEPSGAKVRVEPKDYAATRVDLGALRGELPQSGGSAVVEIPGPDGRPQSFRVERTQRMESELAAAHSEIATWSGVGRRRPALHHRPRHHPDGLPRLRAHARRPERLVRRPRLQPPGTTAHLSYPPRRPAGRRSSAASRARSRRSARPSPRPPRTARPRPAAQVQRHYYRLALTSDPSYAAYFGTANVLAEKVTLINRVNQIYNDDLATELRLVNDTEKLNLDTDAEAIGPDGPCGDAPCFEPSTTTARRRPTRTTSPATSTSATCLTLGQEPHRPRAAHRCVELRRRPHRAGQQRRWHRLPRRRRRRLQGRRLHRPARAQGRLLRRRLRRARDRPPVRRQPHVQRRPRRLRRQHLRGLGRAGLRLVGDGLRRHLPPGRPAAAHRPLLLAPHRRRGRRLPCRDLPQHRGADRLAARASAPVTPECCGSTAPPHRSLSPPTRRRTSRRPSRASPAATSPSPQWGFDEFGLRRHPRARAGRHRASRSSSTTSPTVSGATAADVDRRAADGVGHRRQRERHSSVRPRRAVPPSTTASCCPRRVRARWPTTPRRWCEAPGRQDDPCAARRSRSPARPPIPTGRPRLPLGADQLRRRGRHPPSDNTKIYGPLFRVFGDDAVVTDEDSLQSPVARDQHRRRQPDPGLPRPEAGARRQHQRRHRHLPGRARAAAARSSCPTRCSTATPSSCRPRTISAASLADDRVMRFRLTARDLLPQRRRRRVQDDVALTVDPTAGPFLVTSQASPRADRGRGPSVPVTWDGQGHRTGWRRT